MSLQNVSSKSSFGVLKGEENIYFDRSLPVHTAMESDSVNDRMMTEHNETEGFTWEPKHYVMGMRFASGKDLKIAPKFKIEKLKKCAKLENFKTVLQN